MKIILLLEEVNELNRKALAIALALVIVAILVTPLIGTTLARNTKSTYTIGVVGTPGPADKVFDTGDIRHTKGGTGTQIVYGTPWGDGTAQTSKQISNMNLVDFTGKGVAHTKDTYPAGTIEGIINFELPGIGLYVYQGPTFTYDTLTVKAGDTFIGILMSGIAVKTGNSGDLNGVQMRGDFSGVILLPGVGNPSVLEGKNLVRETGVYW